MIENLAGRGALVTGAANGIGRGIARALAQAGANVTLADIEQSSLDEAQADLQAFGTRIDTVQVDVSDRTAMLQAATEVAACGKLHVVVNNAGISLGSLPVATIDEAQWDWIIGVNVRGVVNGVAAFLPLLQAHGEPAHVVNTASIGGLQVNPILRNGSYSMTKYAVVALSETLALDLAGTPVGVSVLCPAGVRSSLARSSLRRPARLGGAFQPEGPAEDIGALSTGDWLQPDAVGRRVLHAMAQGDFFIFTHPATRAWIEARHARLVEGFDALDRYLAEHGDDAPAA